MIPQPIDQVPLFLRLSEEERELVTARLRRRTTQPDEMIFTAGHPSDAFFIVASGWVKLSSADSKSTIANLGAGSLIGEVDTLLGREYSVSAKSSGKTQLLTLSRLDLEDLINMHPGIGLKFSASLGLRIGFLDQYLIHQRLRGIELLSALSEEDLRVIAQKLDFRAFERGDMFVETGEPGDAVFFIEEGQVRLITESADGDTFEELGESGMFGHTALITGKSYPWNARAVSDISLWILTRASYQELVDDHPAIKLAFTRALEEQLSPSDQGEAMDKMRELPLFSDIPTEALTALVARFVLRHFPANEVIYAEGTPGDALYIVETGEVKLFDSAFSDAQLLERIKGGETFGEMALLTGRTRAECARAGSDVTLWVLYRNDFDDLMVQYPEISVSLSRAISDRLKSRESDFVERHLQRITLLQGLTRSEIKQVAKKVRGLRFRPGERVCYAGQPAENLFMIERGEIKRSAGDMRGDETIVDILAPGDSFGEQVIVKNGIYNTTAQANEDTEIWSLSKTDFSKLMETFPVLQMSTTKLLTDRLARARGVQTPLPGGPQLSPTGRPIRGGFQMPRVNMPRVNMPHMNMPHVNMPRVNVPRVNMPQFQRPAIGGRPAQRPTQRDVQRPISTRQSASSASRAGTLPSPQTARPASGVQPQPGSFSKEFGPWINNLSVGGKLRILTLILLMLWLVLITVPATALTSVSSAVGGVSLSNSSGSNGAASQSTSRGSGFDFPLKFAFAVASPTPKPTATPLPSPTPTARPIVVALRPQPTTAPTLAPAAPAAPPLPPISWDPRLGPNGIDKVTYPDLDGVKILPVSAPVSSGQKFWRITVVKFEGIGESGNNHDVFIKLLGEDGKRVSGKKLHLSDGTTSDEKSADDICDCNYNIAVFTGGAPDVYIDDQYPSETMSGMCLCGIQNVFRGHAHVNFRITYQLVTKP